jgi:exopolysaccharide production protein ExoZ
VKRLRSIQVLRAVAACAVVVLHVYPKVHAPVGNAGYGAAGVDLFFVISGFIMAHVSRGRTAGQFLGDRWWRIYPLWWVAVLPWLLILALDPIFIVSSLSLWPIYPGGYFFPALKVGWTLTFELLFYGGVALALARGPAVVLALYAGCLAGALTTSNPLLHLLGSPMALEFLMGVAVAKLPRRAIFGLLVPVAIALVALTSPATGDVESSLGPQWALWRALVWGCPAAMMVWGTLSLERIFERRAFNLPVAIGDASYSVYLFHPLVAYGLAFVWPVKLGLAVGLGWTMHVLVERRIMAARKLPGTAWANLRTRLGTQVEPA